MCQRSIKDGVFERLWRGAVQNIAENAPPTNQNISNAKKTRNQKRFRRWKKRSLMKKQKILMSRKKNNQLQCGGHCLGWMELNRALANVDPNKSAPNNFCCCSTRFHINQCLQFLLSKTGQTTKSLKSVVR